MIVEVGHGTKNLDQFFWNNFIGHMQKYEANVSRYTYLTLSKLGRGGGGIVLPTAAFNLNLIFEQTA